MRAPNRLRRARARGLTLLEVLVAVTILALVGTLIYGAFDGMSKSRTGLERMNERYRQGRGAVQRMARELQAAFLSVHQPFSQSQYVRTTSFIGKTDRPAARIDFCSFSHMRTAQGAHESDQNELSYMGSRDPDRANKFDLVRREAKFIDLDAQHGGVTNVVAEDISSFELSYLDPTTDQWLDTWDSTQQSSQLNRLPIQIKITLILNGGAGNQPIKFQTKAPIAMQQALSFALPR